MASTTSCLVATAIAPSAPPSASEPVSPMKIIAGGALNQRNPRPAPTSAPQITASSPAPCDEMDLQIIGEDLVADEIGDDAKGRRRDHHRHDGEPVKAVRQIDRVAGAGDDEDAEHEEQSGPDRSARP